MVEPAVSAVTALVLVTAKEVGHKACKAAVAVFGALLLLASKSVALSLLLPLLVEPAAVITLVLVAVKGHVPGLVASCAFTM